MVLFLPFHLKIAHSSLLFSFFLFFKDDDVPSAPAPAPKQEAPAAAAPARGTGTQKSRGGPASRGGKYYPRGGKPPSKDATPVTEETEGQKKCTFSFLF